MRLARAAGFFPVELHLDAEIRATEPRTWEGFVRSAGNPTIPTVGEAMEQALTPSERDRLTSYLRPLVEQGRGEWRMATAHLVATKPPITPCATTRATSR
jgi:hypothetical protein